VSNEDLRVDVIEELFWEPRAEDLRGAVFQAPTLDRIGAEYW
jgi:hypothetical protein